MRNLSSRQAPALARPIHALSALALLLTLAACGGGGSDSAGPASPAPDTACQTTTTAGGTITVGSGVPGDPALAQARSRVTPGRVQAWTALRSAAIAS